MFLLFVFPKINLLHTVNSTWETKTLSWVLLVLLSDFSSKLFIENCFHFQNGIAFFDDALCPMLRCLLLILKWSCATCQRLMILISMVLMVSEAVNRIRQKNNLQYCKEFDWQGNAVLKLIHFCAFNAKFYCTWSGDCKRFFVFHSAVCLWTGMIGIWYSGSFLRYWSCGMAWLFTEC